MHTSMCIGGRNFLGWKRNRARRRNKLTTLNEQEPENTTEQQTDDNTGNNEQQTDDNNGNNEQKTDSNTMMSLEGSRVINMDKLKQYTADLNKHSTRCEGSITLTDESRAGLASVLTGHCLNWAHNQIWNFQ